MDSTQSNGGSSTASQKDKSSKVNGTTASSSSNSFEGRPLKDHPKGEWNGKRIGDDLEPGKQAGGLVARYKAMKAVSKRPLPLAHGDGSYPKVIDRPGALDNLKALEKKDFKTLLAIVKGKIKGEKIKDDKTMIMEDTIQIVAKLPANSLLREKMTNTFIQELWESLDHPPMIHMGADDYRFRKPDGSNNNPTLPSLGAAGTTYARSVPPKKSGLGAQPDPGLLFDSIFARNEYTKHPNNVSSILWYWATIITHDLFWTDYRNPTQNKTSSYLDLSPLYGSSQEMLDSVRTFKDGKLKADSFADKRLLGQPPGVCTLIVMFNRFHNHCAENLAALNEGGRFTPPSPDLEGEAAEAAWKRYDEELFQTARLVTSGLYINITLVDYVRNIINLNRTNTDWTLDPRQEAGHHVGTEEGAEAGVGNLVSAEFNLCYRWHSCISEKDERWIEKFYGEILGPAASEKKGEFTPADMAKILGNYERSIPEDPVDRTFGGFKRGADGKFSDDDLADCIASAIDDPAGSFGGRNVPKVMRPVEIMGILHGRKWNLSGLNEFRKHFGLKAYETFEDINSDPNVHEPLRHLYGKPDNVELYPGIVAEEAKSPMVPGVGIAPTYTISRVVLSDAVCLVRGDRFYTNDFHPRNLTNWGFNEANYDLKVNHGCIFYKLFIRALPNHFKGNSVYAHYPMVTSAENRRILTDLGRVQQFDFDRPSFRATRVDITTYGGAQHVLEKQETYKVTWAEGLGLTLNDGGRRFMLSGDTKFFEGQRQCMHAQLYKPEWRTAVKSFYATITEKLLAEKSWNIDGSGSGPKAGQRHVDLIRDVGNIAHVHFASRVFNFPLKTAENPKGLFAEHEMYSIMAIVFVCVFFDIDPVKSFPLRQGAREAAAKLGGVVEANVKLTNALGVRGLFTGKEDKEDPLAAYGTNVVKGFKKAGLSNYDIAWSQILPTSIAMVPNQAQVFAQAVDYYLGPGNQHVAAIHEVAKTPSSEASDRLLLGYAMEGIRMAGTFGSYRKAASDDTIVEDDGREVPVKKDDNVFVSFVGAAKDPERFPEPEEVDPRRPLDKYIHYGLGAHACLGRDASQTALTEMFRALFKKSNVRRAPGPQGELKKVPRPGGFFVYATEDWSGLFPFPCSMKIMWDE